MCVTNGFCQLIYSLHAMGTRSKIVQYPKSLNNQKKAFVNMLSEQWACCRLLIVQVAFTLCGLIKLWYRFLWQFRRKPYFFLLTRILYKLHYGKYGSCIKKNLFWARSYFGMGSIVESQHCRVEEKLPASPVPVEKKCNSFVLVILKQLLIISLHKITRNYITTKWVGIMLMWITVKFYLCCYLILFLRSNLTIYQLKYKI